MGAIGSITLYVFAMQLSNRSASEFQDAVHCISLLIWQGALESNERQIAKFNSVREILGVQTLYSLFKQTSDGFNIARTLMNNSTFHFHNIIFFRGKWYEITV